MNSINLNPITLNQQVEVVGVKWHLWHFFSVWCLAWGAAMGGAIIFGVVYAIVRGLCGNYS